MNKSTIGLLLVALAAFVALCFMPHSTAYTYSVVSETTPVADYPVEIEITPATPVRISELAPCEFEGSDNCFWDASTRGNGIGQSFVVINGEVFYK